MSIFKQSKTQKNGFRMWKSGKHWLFGLGTIGVIFFSPGVQAFADDATTNATIGTEVVQPTESNSTSASTEQTGDLSKVANDSQVHSTPTEAVESTNSIAPAAMTAPESTEKEYTQNLPSPQENAPTTLSATSAATPSQAEPQPSLASSEPVSVSESKPVDVTTAKPVHIFYETTDMEDNYYLHVWNTGSGKSEEVRMEKVENKFKATIQPKADVTFFNYIIKKGGENQWGDKRTSDMTATVNPYTETNIYVGKDFYSQISNLQSDEFDRKFAYKDKEVNASEPDKFKTVGSAGRLGATLEADGTATINLWAPTAKEVKLNLYKELTSDAKAIETFEMKRGTVANQDDHTQNTVGLWSYKIDSDILSKLGLKTAEKLAYDFTLSIPNAYFIQVEEQEINSQTKEKIKVYRNSATGKVLNYIKDKPTETVLGTNRAATREEVSAFYAGDTITKVKEGNEEKIKVSSHNNQIVTTQDPYSVAVISGGTRSVILDVTKIGPKVEVTKNKRAKTNSQVSVLEVNIRDFSIDSSSGVKDADKGNYLGFIQEGTKIPNSDTMTGLDYLKYRGVNYLQMMPLNDFETVPELPKDDPQNNVISKKEDDGVHNNQQNWGYDPKNYNVPEGSYASDPADPTNRIKELKEMMKGLHDAGLNVVLDVVYNHLYHGQKNVFEQTVPGYYYAINQPANVMNNDIFVGNAVRSNSEMMRRYIINSVAFWAAEYGMDGFRFDAMSDLDVDTLNAVRDALNIVGNDIVTYGEGWASMGTYLPKGQAGADVQGKKIPTYGFFDATSRNSIVGHAHDKNLDPAGFVNNGNTISTKDVSNSLLGGNRDHYSSASQQLNYVECHDGMTLSDLLKRYNEGDKTNLALHINRLELATAMSAFAQGIHFSQHGQEFLRTKNDSVNTYNSGDEYNKIDWNLVPKHVDVVNFAKAITQLRLAEQLFQLSDYSEINKKMMITNAQQDAGVITYELRIDGQKENINGKYLVIFNNNKRDGVSELTLGGKQWYYGGNEDFANFKNYEDNRGIINPSNDFSNAFLVTTNAKKLYSKIGQRVGTKELTVDALSATVLFIPAPSKAVDLQTQKRTINYVDRQSQTVSPSQVQEVTYLTVEEMDPSLKFGFEKSQIATKEGDLGHETNIVKSVSENTPRVQKVYMATDGNGKAVKTDLTLDKVAISDDGLPINSNGVVWTLVNGLSYYKDAPGTFTDTEKVTKDEAKWKASVFYSLSEVPHPSVTDHKVQKIEDGNSGDLVKTNKGQLVYGQGNQTVTVTYAKPGDAVLYSKNDPENKLNSNPELAQDKGLEGEIINLNILDSDLARVGYSYRVNGEESLTAALTKQGTFQAGHSIFEVIYTPKPAQAKVIYFDLDSNKAVKEEILKGETAALIPNTLAIPENYFQYSQDLKSDSRFDNLFDEGEQGPSQTFTINLRHKHIDSLLTRTYQVAYTGLDSDNPETKTEEVTWTKDLDLVTNMATYRPNVSEIKVTSPVRLGYSVSQEEVIFNLSQTDVEPSNQLVTVRYEAKPAVIQVQYLDLDKNKALVKTENVNGLVGQEFKYKVDVPENYRQAWNDFGDVTHFDDANDDQSPSQVVRVYLKHQTELRSVTSSAKVVYSGAGQQTPPEASTTITWTRVEDLVTGESLYEPENTKWDVPSPKIEGYRPSRESVNLTFASQKEEPQSIIEEVVYRLVSIPATKIEDIAKKTIPATKIENNAKTTIPATKIENIAKTTIPATKIENTAKTTIPATKIENTAKTTIPATKIENTAKTTIPATKIENTAKTTIPATKIENTAKTTIPATKIEDIAKKTIPATKIENNAKTTIPATKIDNNAKTTIPATKIEDIAKKTIPAIKIENIAKKTIPATKIENTAKTTIPTTKIENTAKTTIPATKIENTAKTTIPATKIEDIAKKTIPATKIENNAKTTIPAIKIENNAKTTIPATKIENTAKTTIPATKIENTAKTTIPATKIENNAKTTIPATKIENNAKTTIPTTKIENTAKTTIPATKIEDSAKKTIPATKIENNAKTTIPATKIDNNAKKNDSQNQASETSQELQILILDQNGNKYYSKLVKGPINSTIADIIIDAPEGYVFSSDVFVDPIDYELLNENHSLRIFGTLDDSPIVNGQDSHQQLLTARLIPISTTNDVKSPQNDTNSPVSSENDKKDISNDVNLSTEVTSSLPKTGETQNIAISLAGFVGIALVAYLTLTLEVKKEDND